jgi:anthranilate synthase component 1
MIDYAQFAALAENYTVIPLEREILADHETPISMVHRLQQNEQVFLLESVEGGELWGRWSIIGFGIERQIRIEGEVAYLLGPGAAREALPGNPIDAMQAYLASFKPAPRGDLPRFYGGAVGYLSFESVRFFERCGEARLGDGRFPDATFLLCDQLAIFDNVRHSLRLIHCVHVDRFDSVEEAWQAGQQTLAEMTDKVMGPGSAPEALRSSQPVELVANMPREQYERIVKRAKEYIQEGDIIQVVLAQHFSGHCEADPLTIYRALRYVNPSPYMYFLKLDDERAVVGSSPEVLVRVTGDKAEIRPIAGTRHRGDTPEEDARLQEELLADPKERAEHVMLVDLARNDLGRVAQIGSVEVKEQMYVENYSHVMHLVSMVQAKLRPDCDAIDVLKASFPAGTLSGAPKVRAMEIIAELEPCARGPYGGALGHISYGGENMDLAITIRTVVCDGPKATVTAGAGIVFDSVPENEYMETIHKSNGMRKALELAAGGLALSRPQEDPA